MNNLSVFCADVGSIQRNNFGWAAELSDGRTVGNNSIESFAETIVGEIAKKSKIALGFECPLFVPMRREPNSLNRARKGEGNRSWSASVGASALATGIVEVLWLMNRVNKQLYISPIACFNWDIFTKTESIFLWEAFVTAEAKGKDHCEDAQIAVKQFKKSLPDPWASNAIEREEVFSLVGAAAIRAGWSEEIGIISEQCLVIKA